MNADIGLARDSGFSSQQLRWARRDRRRLYRERADRVATPSLDDLIEAYRARQRPEYGEVRFAYEVVNGRIRDSWFANHIHAGAVIVRPPGWATVFTRNRKINIRYHSIDATSVQPEFEATIRSARALERRSALILGGRSRKVLVEMLYTILVYLLSVLDATNKAVDDHDGSIDERQRASVAGAIAHADDELKNLEKFAQDAANRASLRYYLLGLPGGALVGYLLISIADKWSQVLVAAPTEAVKTCFGCGAVGAIVSVMARITHGIQEIDSQQGRTVTFVAGGFRPLIGGVFGLALYVFVEGGLIPLEVPDGDASGILFFAGLAFLSGFNERWAQDTIVQSEPLALRNRSRSKESDVDDGASPDATAHA